MAEETASAEGFEVASPAGEPPSPRPEPKPRKRSGLWAVLAVAVIGLGGFALAWFDPMKWRDDGGLAALTAQVADLQAALEQSETAAADLTARIAQLEAAPKAEAVSPQDLAAVEAKIAALQSSLNSLAAAPAIADGSIPAASFAALQARVEDLAAALAKAGTVTAPSDADIAAAVDKAMADWQAGQSARAEAEVQAARAKAARIDAVERLRLALTTGGPYVDALAALDETDVPDVLRSHAEAGLPSTRSLADSFPEAARTALEASLRATGGGDMTSRFLTFLRIQTGARSLEPKDGDDPDAVLSRAEAAVVAGDIPAALSELAALPAEGQQEMKAWSDAASLHVAAMDAVAALAAELGL